MGRIGSTVHILRTTTPIPINYGAVLPPGEWLCQDEHAFQWASLAPRGTVSVRPYQQDHAERIAEAYEGAENIKSILLIRSGAIGDLLLLTPAIKALRAKHPGALIWLSCFKKHWDVFAQGDTNFIEYPLQASGLGEFDLIIPLEHIIELSTEQGIHATDACAEALGVTVADYKPVYTVTTNELVAATTVHPHIALPDNKRRPRLGLQIHPSSQVRAYPHWNRIIHELLKRGWDIMLLGAKDGIKGGPPELKDCSAMSFREAAAVLSTCDVFLGPDSSFFNLCPALGVPAIGLFGPVDWRTRVKAGSGQLALSGVGDCAPCGWTNSRGGRQWPEGGPCEKVGCCVPLAEIDPMRVVGKVDAYRK